VKIVPHISGKSKINYTVLFVCSYIQREKNDQYKSLFVLLSTIWLTSMSTNTLYVISHTFNVYNP